MAKPTCVGSILGDEGRLRYEVARFLTARYDFDKALNKSSGHLTSFDSA
jgi:hypothetical protein